MASSYSYFKEEVKEYLKSNYRKYDTILDVGAGEGTYYNLLSDHFKKMYAVEVFEPNIINYDLENKYKIVYNADISDFKYGYYDIIIFGDIIEHLDINDAQNVLKYAFNRCKQMIVAVPYMYEQGIEEDNIYEIHKQPDLTPDNVLERYPMLKLLYRNDLYGYYIKNDRWNYEDSGRQE